MSETIFTGLSRGVPGIDAREMAPPASEFEGQKAIAESASLRYSPDKFFLGVIGAEIEQDAKTGERYAQGGVEIGVADDRHVITIAGTLPFDERRA